MKTGHGIAWEREKVLDINSNDRQRVNLEARYIRLKKAEMNRDVGTLSMDYDCLIRLEQKKDIITSFITYIPRSLYIFQ